MNLETTGTTNSHTTRKYLLVVCLILALAVVIGLLILKKQHPTITKEPLGTVHPLSTPQFSIEGTANSQLPPLFPKDFPQESGAKIIQNVTSTSASGVKQSTRVYETSKSLSDNLSLFKAYFTQHGWNVRDESPSGDLVSLIAAKEDQTATLSVTENQLTKTKTVYIYLSK